LAPRRSSEEEDRDEHQHGHAEHEVLDQERPDAEDAHLDQRRRGAHLDPVEHHQQHRARRDAQADGRVRPAPDISLLETENAQPDPRGDQDQAPVVHPGRPVIRGRARYRDQRQRDQRHRDVDPEDGAPGPLGQVAAQQRADRGQAAGDAEEQGEGAAPLAQRKRLHDDRQRGREHDRAARALERAERNEPRLGQAALRGQPAQRRRAGEDDDAEGHHPPVAHRVGQPATEGEQRRQCEQVGVDGPLHAGGGQAEFALDLRHGDGHDGLVDERHRDGEDHRRQDQVPGTAWGRTDCHIPLPQPVSA